MSHSRSSQGRISRRTVLRLMGTGAAGALLAACAPAATPTASPVVATAVPPTNAKPNVAADVNGLKTVDFQNANIDWQRFKGVTLGLAMLQSPPATDLVKDAVKVFELVSGATVNITELDQNALNDRRFADFVSKAGAFDVAWTEFELLPGYVKAGLIEPLQPFIDNANQTDKSWLALDDIYSGVLAAGTVGNAQYALPLTTESTILSYRKDLISAPPDTYDDLMKMAAAAFKPNEIAGFEARAQRGAGQNVYIWAGFLHGFGGNFLVDYPNDMHPAINSPEALAAAEFYAEILQKYGPAGVANYTNNEVHLDGQNGKTASLIEWSGHPILTDSPANSKTAGKWGFAQVPKGPGGRWPAIFSWTVALNAASKNKEAGWALMECMAAPTAGIHNSSGLIIPTRKSVADSAEYKTGASKLIAGFSDWAPVNAEALATAKPDYRPRFAEWIEVGDTVGIALQSVIAKEKSAKDAFDKAQADIEKLLKDKNVIS